MRRGLTVILLLATAWPSLLRAQTLPPASVAQAVVWVLCADRQGSGTVINGEQGYVLTNAHVVMDVDTKQVVSSCTVGFLNDPTKPPAYYYTADIDRYVYNTSRNQDFAILKIGQPLSRSVLPLPFPSLKTFEFSVIGDAIQVLGYSASSSQRLVVQDGTITAFQNGFIDTTAAINPGDSGGAAIDSQDALIGVPTEVVTVTQGTQETKTSELVDVRAVMNWLDTYGTNFEDNYFTHLDYVRYHQSADFITQADLGCVYVARTPLASTVYCLKSDGTREVFPNDATYFSWFPDFQNVVLATIDSIAQYTLSRNVTYKPGTLVKSATAPPVYVVVDGFGTIRWIPSEDKAIQLWGSNWASFVHDIPDEFWTNYTIGQPLN